MAQLELQKVSCLFANGSGVRDLSFEVKQGEGFSLLGPSGCGKTTTLRLLSGFIRPQGGQILFNGKDIGDLPPQRRPLRTVFQKYALFPHLNVFDNVAFGLKMQKIANSEIRRRVEKVVDLLAIAHLQSRGVKSLSGGEQQRVAVARALVTEPQILLLDEPLSALDLKLREKMQMELLALRKKLGSTFVFVTHDQSEAMILSDRLAVMNEGSIVQIGTPEEIYLRPKTRFVATFIGQANFFSSQDRPKFSGAVGRLPNLTDDQSWLVRPEHFTFVKGPLPESHVGLSVRVMESVFLGSERLLKVVDASEKSILVRMPGFERAVASGENLILAWDVEDTWAV